MASSTLTADRRWASSRKSGMTVLGKVPKPINLPSQRLENNGLDPNVEIVPKGTITWGSRPNSSSNPWNSSSSILSPKIEAASSSPPDLMGRPGSSGSSTRPSTGNTDRQLGSDPSHAWGPNSRPSSASGSFASGHPLASPNRPRSADTRPGSSQLSRFAESSGESKGFTLSSGDFPTLGAEKPTDHRRGHSSHGRPTSGAGRDARPKEALDNLQPGHDLHMRPTSGEDNMTKAPNTGDSAKTTDGLPKIQNVNILKTDDPSNTNWYSETPYQYPSHPYHQPGPNQPNAVLPVPAPQYDASSWRAPPPPPMQQTPEGTMWYPPGPHAPGPHGPGPYRPSGPPNNYPIDPFVYYPPPPHFRPPNAESAPRPHMPPPHNPYMMPAHPVSIPARHGPHAPYAPVPPISYDGGFYGPRAGVYGNRGHNHNNNRSNFNSSNNNQQAILSQGQNQSPRSSASGSGAAPKQYKVLLKHKEEEKRDEKQPEPTVLSHGKEHSSEHSEKQQQPVVKKNSGLIQKIGELNSKARSLESSHAEFKEERPKPGEGILGTPSVIIEAGVMSIHPRIGEEVAAVRQHHAERRLNEQRRTRQRPAQAPNHVVPVKMEAVLDNASTTGSDKVISLRNEGDEGMASDVNLPPLDPAEYEIQRALLKEKAAQRAKELQREEEERIREQKAKALAKLEELNRRATTQKESVEKESEPSLSVSDSHFQQEPSVVITADTHIQEVPQKSAESGLGTVTLSFGTISEVQITTGKVTHISEVPISSMKTSVDAGAFAIPLGTSSSSGGHTGAVAVVSAGTGTSFHARHHHAKQMGYKKRHGSNLNAPVEVRSAEKVINVENPTEPLKQTDAQGPAGDSTQHKDDTVSLQRKKGNRNPKNRIKTEVPMPVSVPVQSVAPLDERPGKGLNEKIQTSSSTAATSGNSNLVQPENSSKEDLKPIEGGCRSGSVNNRAGPHWKAQQQRRQVRNNRTSSEKSHSNETVIWAPVKHPKEEITQSVGTSEAVAAPKIDVEVHAGTKTKRVEIERYVPKPQLSQMDKKPDESTDVKAGETLLPSEAKAEEVNSRTVIGTDSTNNLNKSVRRGGKPHASWRQRVVPSEMQETIFQNPTDSEKTLAYDSQVVMPSPARKDYEDGNPDGRPKRQSGHKLYKATGSNYIGHGTSRSGTENIGEIVDGTITGTDGKSENTEAGSSEVSNYGSNNRSQHWKPKSQTHVHSHGRGNVGWQKVVSEKAVPVSGKSQDEDKPVTSANAEDSGSAAPRRQRGNARQYKSGTSEDREINRDPQPVVESYQRVTGEDGAEGSKRVASGSRYRGRGRNGHFARRASELST